MTTEVDKFFEDLPSQDKREAHIFKDDEPQQIQTPAEGEQKPEEGNDDKIEPRKNRRERRMEERLKRTEDMNIALTERVKVLSETQQFKSEFKPSDEMPAEWIALYGNTPEAKQAWQVNQQLINRAKDEAKKEALQEFEDRQRKSLQEQHQFESLIDTQLESLEDEFDVDLTSNSPAARKARREFLELVQDLSPKDENGNLVNYADFGKTFEIYQSRRQQPEKNPTIDKKKELASRGMTQGNSSPTITTVDGPINFQTARRAISQMIKGN